jgi:hypothetical protein
MVHARCAGRTAGHWGRGHRDHEAVVVRDGIYAVTASQLAQRRSARVVVDDPRRRLFTNVTRRDRRRSRDHGRGGVMAPRPRTSELEFSYLCNFNDPYTLCGHD